MTDNQTPSVVVGAGVVGICCALALQQRGLPTLLVDPNPPGSQTSAGNAGGIGISEILPMAMPGLFWKLPKLLLDPLGPVSIRWSHLPSLAPWLLHFARATSQQRMKSAVCALSALLASTYQDLKPLLKASNTQNLLVENGALTVYGRAASFHADDREWRVKREFGIDCQAVSRDELRELEPALSSSFECGVLVPSWSHLTDPHAFARALFELFMKRGGQHLRHAVVRFQISENTVTRALTREGRSLSVDKLVIAAGAWSKPLASILGSYVPLESERGYNTTLPTPGVSINREVIFAEKKFVITPMSMGLRIGGTAEFAGLEVPPNFERSKALVTLAKRYVPQLDIANGSEWMGHRPSLPDSVPVISKSPSISNVLMAFGHGHLGLTQAATTGRLIAQMATGQTPDIDMSPYQIDRFQEF